MEKPGPKTEIERRYVAMARRFVRAIEAQHYRRAKVLGGELDHTAATIGKDRVKQLDDWVFAALLKEAKRSWTKTPRHPAV